MGPQRGKGWNKQGWHSHLIEKGTKPHIIMASPGKMMPIFRKGSSGPVGWAASIDHPGYRGTFPFKRATDSTWEDVAGRTMEKLQDINQKEIAIMQRQK